MRKARCFHFTKYFYPTKFFYNLFQLFVLRIILNLFFNVGINGQN